MDRNQRDLRSAAEQEFLDSLHQLQETLKIEEAKSYRVQPPPPPPNSRLAQRPSPKPAPGFSLDELEQAVADIEAFMDSR